MPTQSGTFNVIVTAIDGDNCPASQTYRLAIGCTTNPVVTNTSDSGDGSLRQAISSACSGSAVTFAIPVSDQNYDAATGIYTFNLRSVGDSTYGPSALLIDRNIVIDGGANKITITRDGSIAMRLFYVTSGGALTLRSLRITGGYARGGNGGDSNVGGGVGGAAGLAERFLTQAP